ncbi:hypothetical protein BDV25DRAFT_130310 [Aspergillus avenaceus]|uniref:V-type proton ATPase subunit C n=1 Tax=Aspergillus avenaceus TaxID=36643 RepID=A0A5N6TT49_ASPAV|nr:hypothetical protein BDV25DRAFT_130310 [Aspergillus avenaceus]
MSVIHGFGPLSMPARLAFKSAQFSQMRGCCLSQTTTYPFAQANKNPRRYLTTQVKTATGDLCTHTWLTKTPEEITPDDVLSSLPHIPPSLSGPNNVPVILLTPGFAQWADITHPFGKQWVNRFHRNTAAGDSAQPLHTIVAIVDKLPDTHPESSSSTSSVVGESEGISVLFERAENIEGTASTPRRIRSSETTESTLLFSFRGNPTYGIDGSVAPQSIHEVGLRLANTLFINGRENTLYGIRWSFDASSSSFVPTQSVDLSHCKITSVINSKRASLQLPLHPVGQRREVISSMGNILRQLAKYPDGRSKDPMPASSELERELPRYIEEYDVADHRVSVWALVESGHSLQSETDVSQSRLPEMLEAGAKLHRVMSGGGGWGKKQGLLSLDYETSFVEPDSDDGLLALDHLFSPVKKATVRTEAPSFEWPVGENLSALSQVAKSGDYVQFYVSVEPDQITNSGSRLPLAGNTMSYHFGVVFDPDSPLDQQMANPPQKDLRTVRNCFGALSEKAITYLQPIARTGSEGTSPSSTKLDIPGSRIDLTPFFGALGCTSAIVFTCFGAAYGTAKAGVGVCGMAVLRPDLIVKNIVPIVMAGIIGIYGLVVSVLIANDLAQSLPLYTGFIQLGAGLAVGLAGLAAGFAIGIVGDAGVRGTAQQPRLYVGMILILIFAEVLGLYGLIVALLMNSRAKIDAKC